MQFSRVRETHINDALVFSLATKNELVHNRQKFIKNAKNRAGESRLESAVVDVRGRRWRRAKRHPVNV